MTSGPLPAPEPATDRDARPHRAVRVLDGIAGLLAAGILLLGVLLLASALVAPSLLAAADLGAADGPGWDRVALHLGVGVVGELVVRFRRRWPTTLRVGADVAVVLAAIAVIGWSWWP